MAVKSFYDSDTVQVVIAFFICANFILSAFEYEVNAVPPSPCLQGYLARKTRHPPRTRIGF